MKDSDPARGAAPASTADSRVWYARLLARLKHRKAYRYDNFFTGLIGDTNGLLKMFIDAAATSGRQHEYHTKTESTEEDVSHVIECGTFHGTERSGCL